MIMKAKRNILRLFCAAAAITLTTACSSGDYEHDIGSASIQIDGPYIQKYYDGPLQCQMVAFKGDHPYIAVSLDTNIPENVREYSSSSTGLALKYYKTLCDKHNDNDFHGRDALFDSPMKICYANDISGIELTCERDFDSTHPAGSSLLDIMQYNAYSFGPFVSGGYVENMSDWRFAMEHIMVGTNNASDIPESYMTMLSCSEMFRLTFLKSPTNEGVYKMTLSVTLDDGQVKTLPIEFSYSRM